MMHLSLGVLGDRTGVDGRPQRRNRALTKALRAQAQPEGAGAERNAAYDRVSKSKDYPQTV